MCAVAAAERGEALFATASQVHRWLLIEVRGPWGRDVVDDTALAEHVPADWRSAMKAEGIRPIAIRRDLADRDPAGPVRAFYIEAGRGADPGRMWTRELPGLEHVAAVTGDLPGDWQRADQPIVLVCTNGRHDGCCATFGRPVVRELRTTPLADAVWECTHVGGDRFAGNIVVLPASVYFGRVAPDRAQHLVEHFFDNELDLECYRGRSTLPYGAQAAEHFARQELGLTTVDGVVDVHRAGPTRYEVELRDGAPVVVDLARDLTPSPTPLTCAGPSGASYPTYRLVAIDRRTGPDEVRTMPP